MLKQFALQLWSTYPVPPYREKRNLCQLDDGFCISMNHPGQTAMLIIVLNFKRCQKRFSSKRKVVGQWARGQSPQWATTGTRRMVRWETGRAPGTCTFRCNQRERLFSSPLKRLDLHHLLAIDKVFLSFGGVPKFRWPPRLGAKASSSDLVSFGKSVQVPLDFPRWTFSQDFTGVCCFPAKKILRF